MAGIVINPYVIQHVHMINGGINVGNHPGKGFVAVSHQFGGISHGWMKAINRTRILECREINRVDQFLCVGRLAHKPGGFGSYFFEDFFVSLIRTVAKVRFAKEEIHCTTEIGQKVKYDEPRQSSRRRKVIAEKNPDRE